MERNFFVPRYFSPFAAKTLAKFSKFQGEITLKMFVSENIIQYEATKYRIFLPSTILSDEYKFGRISEDKPKKLILSLSLSEEQFVDLIRKLGGTYKKVHNPPTLPTLGDLLK